MIIGTKRKEEVITPRKLGIYADYTTPVAPIVALALYKNSLLGRWEIWEMVSHYSLAHAYRAIAGYKTKRQALESIVALAESRDLPNLGLPTNQR